ncbi:MAG TPA: hypothetical protein VL325_08100 [Pyrinomonadaceae bacterium]|nr:hypothetical protein [Pyrinomonadaceae bacterium]
MESIQELAELSYRTRKRNVLLGVLVMMVTSTLADWVFAGNGIASSLISIFTGVGGSVAVLLWCMIDSEERDIKLGPGFRILTVLFGVFCLIYYLFKSRGFTRGLVSTGYSILFFILLFILTIIENIALALMDDRLGMFRNLK